MTAAEPTPHPARQRGRPALHRTTPLERDDILDCALGIVRKEGLEAVSMRRLAGELGVTPMALYHHIPDKPALMNAMVNRVWEVIVASAPTSGDPIDLVVENAINIRTVWLSYFDLASLAVAVAEPDDAFYQETWGMALMIEGFGFPDVPLAFNAIQTFTMGSVEVAANRKAASAYFGRDPKTTLAKARRLMQRRGATADQRGIAEGRFDEGDDAYFEPALRALIAGLLAGN